MSKVVIDTSAIFAVITNEPTKAALVAATAGVDLVAPASLPWEVGNAFSALLKRKRAHLSKVEAALAVYKTIPIRFIDVDLSESLKIAEKWGIYAYDAYFLACASSLHCPLLTLDGGLATAAKSHKVSLLEI